MPGDNKQLLSTTVAKNTNVYDMVMFSFDTVEEFTGGDGDGTYGVDWGILHFDEADGAGFQDGADELSHNPLKDAYSDHRPLWMTFRTNTGNADDGPGGVTLEPPVESATSYVGTKSGSRFHHPTCSTIKNSRLTKKWDSREEAAAVLTPCKVCKP